MAKKATELSSAMTVGQFGHVTIVTGYALSTFTGCTAIVRLRDTPGKSVAVMATEARLQSLLETALATGNLIQFFGRRLTPPPPTPTGGIFTGDVYAIDGVDLRASN